MAELPFNPGIDCCRFSFPVCHRSAWDSRQVFQVVSESLRRENSPLLLVGAGLQPLPELPQEGDMQDLEFLKQLYDLGASRMMPVINLQFPELTGEPMLVPSTREERVFRHYENVRRLMVKNQHNSGVIWVTQITLPSGKIDIQDSLYLNIDAQVVWMSQA